ncbi:MAG TPA: TIM barrel protein [Bacilli bacterium]
MFIHPTYNNQPPKFRIGVALGILGDYPSREQPWSLTEAMFKLKEAGFDCIETWCSPDGFESLEVIAQAARHEGLALGGIFRTESVEEIRQCLSNMKQVGGDYLSLHLAKLNDSNIYPIDAAAIIEQMYDEARTAGIPLFLETHRDTALQDIYQTIRLLEKLNRLYLNLDLSHYVLAGECNSANRTQWRRDMAPILARAGTFHGRISNGNQIQIGLGDHEEEWTNYFIEMWSEAMFQWIQIARPGDVCNFICELIGPPYALSVMRNGREEEIYDRWQQTLLLKQSAEKAWKQAVSRMK